MVKLVQEDQKIFTLLLGKYLDYFSYFLSKKGTGKTHTLRGREEDSLKGIIPRSFVDLFDLLSRTEKTDDYQIFCSYMSLYNETLTDELLSGPTATPLKIR